MGAARLRTEIVTFLDYLYTYYMQTYLDCLLPLHLDPFIRCDLLSLYHYIVICVIFVRYNLLQV